MNRADLLARLNSALTRGRLTVESAGSPKAPPPYPGYSPDHHWVDEVLAAGFRTAGLSLLESLYGKNHYHFKEFYQGTTDKRTVVQYRKALAILEAVGDEIRNDWLDVKALGVTDSINIGAKQALKAFLCHSSGDKPHVDKLYKNLKAAGYDPWLDSANLLPGQDWETEIRAAVKNSHVVIVCLSSKSVGKAGFLQKEIKFALDVADEQPEGRIFIIPARLEECAVPDRLSRWHWVNLFEEDGYEKLLASLAQRTSEV